MKIDLYKESLKKYIKNDNIEYINYLIGILFLTEMNRHCKLNKLYYHGYYISESIIYLYEDIKQKIIKNKDISINNDFISNICKNIKYLNEQRTENENIKSKINQNLYLFILEIIPYLNQITSKIDLSYANVIDKILKPFFYVLLITSKFMASGDYKEPNLFKIAEYYANIIYVYNMITISEDKQDLYDLYTKHKTNLNVSILQLNIFNDTIDEILTLFDKYIVKNL